MSGLFEKRFYRKVGAQKPNGCQEWVGSLNSSGYGQIRSKEHPFNKVLAHRVAYELHYGPVPEGLVVCHKCDNPLCVNPAHLFAGTRKDNFQDMLSKSRQRKSQFTEEEVGVMRDMRRNGLTQREIALQFGCSRPLVSMLLSGLIAAA